MFFVAISSGDRRASQPNEFRYGISLQLPFSVPSVPLWFNNWNPLSTMKTSKTKPLVGIIMGSESDWPTMSEAARILGEFGVPYEATVVSAHRTPEDMVAYAKAAEGRGLRVIIAGAGGAAHLPGMVASLTNLPVVGVPVESKALKGMDSLLSIAQMPGGIPVATMAIGGAKNAGLMAARILGTADAALRRRMGAYRARIAGESRKSRAKVQGGAEA
ncbi:N5-carboxyaminoimidazole ribonucleotide mutase [mine drainage metagenome]|uniref:N5-carboxyaminoimidazole ribonucleotide mutase n=1 Tax=mine drainage metagenome TaxID=410659 RepID=A0A1J5S9D6_9ZZZZ